MDTRPDLESYRCIVEGILTAYSRYRYATGKSSIRLCSTASATIISLLSVGWNKRRVHFCVIHIDLINGKCWIQSDGTEDGIACDLEAAGIPKDRIVLAFKSEKIRPHTGYAVA